ncbi:hypothetical protein FF1_037931 [Malus domestica]
MMQSSWKQRMAEWEKTAVELQMMSSKRMEMREEMIHEIYEKATQEPYETFHGEMVAANAYEQKTRMEANRLKALEKAAARRCQLQAA